MTAPAVTAAQDAPALKPRIRVRMATSYEGAGRQSQGLALWTPALASADADHLLERDALVARARDLVRNDGVAAAAVSRAADLVVGSRLALAAKPDGEALGIDRDAARALGRAMEREWRAFAEDARRFCDRRRRLSFGGLLQLMARQVAGPEGEALAVLGFDRARLERGARYATCLDVIDPDRLSNPQGVIDSETMRAGVESDADGAPIAYHIRRRHAVDAGFAADSYVWDRIEAETAWGRPVVIHYFEPDRAGQSRGVSRFAAILEDFRQLKSYTSAELSNALLNSLFGAFVRTGADAAQIAQAISTDDATAAQYLLETRTGLYEQAPVVMNGLRIPVLAPGDEIQLNTAERATAGYTGFRAAFLQHFASCLGLSYEQLAMDFSRTNYSSARAALNEVWRTVTARRQGLAQAVASPVYLAVMEEAFGRGHLVEPEGAPPFAERPDAYCRAAWIGPSRGSIDPVKDIQGAQMAIDTGLSTLEQECAERGLDYEDVMDQLAYEAAQRAARGLSRAPLEIYGVPGAVEAGPDDPDAAPNDPYPFADG